MGILGEPQSVRSQSQDMGVTRARVYQLLEECARIMQVRWPEGRPQLAQLAERIEDEAVNTHARRLFEATRDLFFPEKDVGPDSGNNDPTEHVNNKFLIFNALTSLT